MRLEGTSAIVTGGTGGLGEAVVRRLLAEGAAVVIADVADEKGHALAEELGERTVYVKTDVLDDATVGDALRRAQEIGLFQHAVVAHGGAGRPERIVGRDGAPADLERFRKLIDIYLTGTYNIVRLAAAAMATNEPDADGGRGAIVTTSSIAAYEGQIGQSSYAVAKAGVAGLTIAAARDLASVGVRVACIAPGTMLTPMMASVGEEMLGTFASAVPFPKRLGAPEEFASLVLEALTNRYLNGETIRLDGAQRFGPK
jgi:NAD(P)-dependent dehydrogenase (short-subunit alcohol dehydrogenase family)